MKSKTLVLLTLGALLASSASAESFTTTEYVKVISSEAIYSTVNEEVPTERCFDEKVYTGNGSSSTGSIGGTLLGGALGGVLGNQVGGGKGKTAATIGGAVLGAFAGNKVGSGYDKPAGNETYNIVRKCEVIKNIVQRQVLSGYNNRAVIKGQNINVESSNKISQIPVTITYSY
jgi:uncharacterized protein YcfJ